MKLIYQQRLRRRVPGDVLPETADFARRVTANGGTLSTSTFNAVDALVRALLEANLWGKILDMGIFAGDQLAAAMVKLKYTTGTGVLVNNNFVAADYVEQGPTGGLLGDGVTKFLRTGLTQDAVGPAAHLAFYLREDMAAGRYESALGAGNGTDEYTLFHADTSFQIRYGQVLIASKADLGPGLWCGTRESLNSLSFYKNGVLQQTNANVASPSPLALDFVLFAKNNNGTVGNHLNRRGAFYSIGAPLKAADQLNLHQAVQAFQTALNRAV